MDKETFEELNEAAQVPVELESHETSDYLASMNGKTADKDQLEKLIRISIEHLAQYIEITKEEAFRVLWAAYGDLTKNNFLQASLRLSRLKELPGSPWFIYNSFEEYLHFCNDFVTRQQDAIHRGIPPLFIVALPKTASSFVASVLAQGLDVPVSSVSLIDRQIVPPWLRCFLRGGAVTHDHLWPSNYNIEILRSYKPKLIILLRDFKQLVVSYVHHLSAYIDKLDDEKLNEFLRWFSNANMELRLNWIIERRVPRVLNWVSGWYRVSQAGTIDIKFLSYESFAADKSAFFDELSKLFNIPTQIGKRLQKKQKELDSQTGMYNMRKKSVDEWREVLSSEQKERIDDMVPAEIRRICQ